MPETYMTLAQKGVAHPDFVTISRSEHIRIEDVQQGVAEGKLAIVPSAPNGRCVALGEGASSKVLCNLGTSSRSPEIETEIRKAKIAVEHGASLLCDQSVGVDIQIARRLLLQSVDVPVGTIPLYRAVEEAKERYGDPFRFTKEDLFRILESEIELGVTQLGIHSMTRQVAEILNRGKRLMPVVSRGGALMYEWMRRSGNENPYFEDYGRLLEIFKCANLPLTFVLSLRSGTVVDGAESSLLAEFEAIAPLIRSALDMGVSVIADGIGHMRLDQIGDTIQAFKSTCSKIPLGVLGPAVTDRGLGHEHVVHAIGTAVAVWKGANYCNACYRTEHLGLPDIEDICDGIGASLVAVHSGDLARSEKSGLLMRHEYKMSNARKGNRWGIQLEFALDRSAALDTFRRVGEQNVDGKGCSICGDLCPFVVSGIPVGGAMSDV